MNILFYTTYKVSSTKGGTERTTISVANGLKQFYHCKCYSLYWVKAETPKENCFEEEFLYPFINTNEELKLLINTYNIDIIIIQGAFSMVHLFKTFIKNLNIKMVFVHHFAPGWEENSLQMERVIIEIFKSSSKINSIKNLAKLIYFPIAKVTIRQRLRNRYKNAYEFADIVVLLCHDFIYQYADYGRISDVSKFKVIPNGLSYNEYATINMVSDKKPIVLIVSRLEERQKRISIALKIWREVKKNPASEGWILNIVGHGPNKEKYEKMIRKLSIPDVCLLGRQQPKPYYEEASIFMMTSRSEGWGLTLTEAQQFGVVPIAFDSYASLRDIITNDEDGIIVPECDVEMYVKKLLNLMNDQTNRKRMALNSIRNCKRFSQEEIAKKWWNLLNDR